jgi:hypothetical protein
VANDDRTRNPIHLEYGQMVAPVGPCLGKLDLVITFDDLSVGINDHRRIVEFRAVAPGHANDGIDIVVSACLGDLSLRIDQLS